MKALNINDIIKVKLTDRGKDIYYHLYDNFNKQCGFEVIKPSWPMVDDDGFTKFKLWYFMYIYGPHLHDGCQCIIEHNNIYIEDRNLEEYNEDDFG